jgi:hypothetical protein
MSVKKKCRECRGGTDGQLGMPRAKCGCLAVLSVTSTINAEQLGKALPMVPRLLKSRLIKSLPREASWMPSGASLSPFNVFSVSAGLFTQHKIRRFGYIIEIPIK